MTSYLDVSDSVIALIPVIPGWESRTFTGGVSTGQSPPWIVASFSEDGRSTSEGGSVTSHSGKLDVRVVSTSASSVGVACERISSALDFARPGHRVSQLVPDRDSGVYASELTQPDTGIPYVMRVLTWRLAWN